MGVGFHHLVSVAKAANGQPLRKIITLGRQQLTVNRYDVRTLSTWANVSLGGAAREEYADEILKKLVKAEQVDSMDLSPYEGATIIHDLNDLIPAELRGSFDAVLDFGTTEHVFDIATTMRNVAAMVAVGGVAVHVAPANNFLAHGLYQFGPDLFRQIYSNSNGFDLDLYLVDVEKKSCWYKLPTGNVSWDVLPRGNPVLCLVAIARKTAEKEAGKIYNSVFQEQWEGTVGEGDFFTQADAPASVQRSRWAGLPPFVKAPLRPVYDFLFHKPEVVKIRAILNECRPPST